MAKKIYDDGFMPDVIYVSLRGGAYIGNVISEYFKILRVDRRPVFYAAVTARSYTGVGQASDVRVDGWTYDPEHLRHGDRVLLVDDIFDSGRTINALANIIMAKGIPREDLKIAVHDYKIQLYNNVQKNLPIQPDYYCRKHVIENSTDEIWIHYLSHELVGLTQDELEKNYYSEDNELRNCLDILTE
ncbi:MAG: phosphoribosyltransferase [Spirochaetales bacterium]|nr:phosphoribosyltransferase [Spirochaetales bacterium]